MLGIPKGFRDFPPEVMMPRLNVIKKIRKVFELYGFPPMDTPVIEHWETLSGKYGEEAEKLLIWRFEDPFSGRMYALRYDLTVPLARFVAMHPEPPLPFKRGQISLVWRHEEPQRMRYREFLQADADIIGSPYPEADAEVLNVISRALRELGVGDFVARVNHRGLLYNLFEKELGLTNPIPVYRAIDKLDKIGEEGVRKELEKIGLSSTSVEKIMNIIKLRGQPDTLLEKLQSTIGKKKPLDDLETIYNLSEHPDAFLLDISLVRGLDYYTGPIMEFGLKNAMSPSLAGGGRYDELIGLFRKAGTLPATGASIGVERVIDVLREKGVITTRKKTSSIVQVVYLTENLRHEAWRLATHLREEGIPSEIDLNRRNQTKQRKHAQKLGIRFVIILGENEVKTGKFTLYDRETGERIQSDIKSIINMLKRYAIST